MRISYCLLRNLLPVLVCASSCFGDAVRKVVALTFDDGPNPPYTEQLLQALATNRVQATFFLIGNQVKAHPDTARNIIAAGHEVGGHSSDWKSLAFKRRATVEKKLDEMEAAFADAGITNLTLFRPPGGILMPWQHRILKERGWKQVSADVVVGDWKPVNSATIVERVLKKVRPGSIVALHDGGGDRSATMQAVPELIARLRRRGYSFVTVSELLRAP